MCHTWTFQLWNSLILANRWWSEISIIFDINPANCIWVCVIIVKWSANSCEIHLNSRNFASAFCLRKWSIPFKHRFHKFRNYPFPNDLYAKWIDRKSLFGCNNMCVVLFRRNFTIICLEIKFIWINKYIDKIKNQITT